MMIFMWQLEEGYFGRKSRILQSFLHVRILGHFRASLKLIS